MMTEELLPAARTDLAEVREHTRLLASELAGPLRKLTVTSGDATIEVEWQPQSVSEQLAYPVPESPSTAQDETAGGHVIVTSPMVGTFYRASSPDEEPFAEVGDTVEPGQTIAIIEAMKLFNPVTAEHQGTVSAVLAENGQTVEFGQPLLRLTVTGTPDLATDGKE